ncbi:hypothetical protein WJX72_000679 [[Myrmecia] bisecta]|uniref:Uncharacterized protein n=1 Tax=[Myrmecia] bisecta TaxID=41462 RepID=A0AAW1R4D3_9CHLO
MPHRCSLAVALALLVFQLTACRGAVTAKGLQATDNSPAGRTSGHSSTGGDGSIHQQLAAVKQDAANAGIVDLHTRLQETSQTAAVAANVAVTDTGGGPADSSARKAASADASNAGGISATRPLGQTDPRAATEAASAGDGQQPLPSSTVVKPQPVRGDVTLPLDPVAIPALDRAGDPDAAVDMADGSTEAALALERKEKAQHGSDGPLVDWFQVMLPVRKHRGSRRSASAIAKAVKDGSAYGIEVLETVTNQERAAAEARDNPRRRSRSRGGNAIRR